MLSVLLLFAAVALGATNNFEKVPYGGTFKIRLSRDAEELKFHSDDVKVLWTSQKHWVSRDPRHSVKGNYYVMKNITWRDEGQYYLWDESEVMYSVYISVEVDVRTHYLDIGESVSFEVGLPSIACNVFYTPKHWKESAELVQRGRVIYPDICEKFSLDRPCKFNIEMIDPSCGGTYEIRDNNEDTALRVEVVAYATETKIPDHVWIGVAAAASLALCCVKCCCCKKSSSKKESSDTEGGEAAAEDAAPTEMQYESQPARLGRTGTVAPLLYPADPLRAPTAPLIHNSNVSQPLSHEETSASTEETGGPLHLLSSTAEPRFELTGMRFSVTPPLSSETASGDVYTSDKLNFL